VTGATRRGGTSLVPASSGRQAVLAELERQRRAAASNRGSHPRCGLAWPGSPSQHPKAAIELSVDTLFALALGEVDRASHRSCPAAAEPALATGYGIGAVGAIVVVMGAVARSTPVVRSRVPTRRSGVGCGVPSPICRHGR
jgi:hypothetical protein